MAAALVGVMALRKPDERSLRGFCVFVCRVEMQPVDGLPVGGFLNLQFTSLPFDVGFSDSLALPGNVFADDRYPRLGGSQPLAEHLSPISPGRTNVTLQRVADVFPVHKGLVERVGAVLLAAEITESALARSALIVAVALDQQVAFCVA